MGQRQSSGFLCPVPSGRAMTILPTLYPKPQGGACVQERAGKAPRKTPAACRGSLFPRGLS